MRAETAAAIASVRAALPLLRDGHGQAGWRAKDQLDYVTPVDAAVEEQLASRLSATFPAYGIFGEEGGMRGRREAFWVIDPICGTTNFATGLPLFNINVALVEDEQVVIGVLLDGTTGEVYWAERGGGAFRDGRPIRASPSGGVVHIDFGHTVSSGKVERLLALQRRILEKRLFNVRVLGTSLVLGYLASGRLAGSAVEAIHPWDMCAGAIIAEEAGATVTDLAGRPWRWDSGELLCGAGPAVHAGLLELLTAPG